MKINLIVWLHAGDDQAHEDVQDSTCRQEGREGTEGVKRSPRGSTGIDIHGHKKDASVLCWLELACTRHPATSPLTYRQGAHNADGQISPWVPCLLSGGGNLKGGHCT
jgi:hypothetical protein